jgi:hypothetical protein
LVLAHSWTGKKEVHFVELIPGLSRLDDVFQADNLGMGE